MAQSLLERAYNQFESITVLRVDGSTSHPLIEMIFVALYATIIAFGIGLGMWTPQYSGTRIG